MKDDEISLSDLLLGNIEPAGEAKPKPVKTPKLPEIQIEENHELTAEINQSSGIKEIKTPKLKESDIQITADRYKFPFRNPAEVQLKGYFAIEPANEVFRDLVFITNEAVLEGKIKVPPTGLLKPGDLITICVVATQYNEDQPVIMKTPKEHQTFPHLILNNDYNINVWSVSADKSQKNPDSLDRLGELVRSLSQDLYQQTRVVLQLREHCKGGKEPNFDETAKKYFSKPTDTRQFEKVEIKERESFFAIKDAIKRTGESKIKTFEELEAHSKDTVILPPKPEEDVVEISRDGKVIEPTDVVIISKDNQVVYSPEELEKAKAKLAQLNHDPNYLGGGK